MEATTERPKRNGVMRRSRLANPTCWPRSLRTSSSRTDWNLLAIVINCWGAIRPSFRSSKRLGGLDGSFQKSPEFQEDEASPQQAAGYQEENLLMMRNHGFSNSSL